jgi:hypothetical protein
MKIVELILQAIDELTDTGIDAVALVENPAIEADFYAFEKQDMDDIIAFNLIKAMFKDMFISKIPGESQDEYIARCIPAIMDEGFDQDQATAICYSDWETFDETQDPQEIIIGDYQTRHYDMCPAATALYSLIENNEIDTDMGLAIRNAKLQDALFYLEKHTVKQMKSASFEDVKTAEILAGEIMHLARMMGLEQEHQYVLGHLQAIRELYQQGLQEDQMGLDPSSLPDFINEIGDKKKVELESYTDYPQSATNAAKRALEWRDAHPDQDCGTRVGWARANQLADRRPISEDTIARMASFARHLQHEDVPYSEGCGGLMVDAWGGRAGIEWAQSKLEQIRTEASKFSFSLQEDQQMVVGPLMIPNKLILRMDPQGNPYYVYFTEQTIAKVARKMMKDKLLDSINLEHDQETRVDGYLVETWLVQDPQKDKQQIYGFNFPTGTWMGQYKINDSNVWEMVKKKLLKGFSIEGYFADRFVQQSK